jgi:hypothetical protein
MNKKEIENRREKLKRRVEENNKYKKRKRKRKRKN